VEKVKEKTLVVTLENLEGAPMWTNLPVEFSTQMLRFPSKKQREEPLNVLIQIVENLAKAKNSGPMRAQVI
jgi:hypothetical protein